MTYALEMSTVFPTSPASSGFETVCHKIRKLPLRVLCGAI
jgi:hypothetical protein